MRFESANNELNSFEKELSRETLKSVRLRELFLILVLVLLLVALLINVLFLTLTESDKHHLTEAFYWFILLIIFLSLRSLIIRGIIKSRLKQGKSLITVLRYINTFIEISVPTVVIIILSIYIDPVSSLLSPALLLYFIFIILSTLELDAKLSVVTGLVAAIEYVVLSIIFLNKVSNGSDTALLNFPLIYFARGNILFIGGIAAALVAFQIKKRVKHSFEKIKERNELEKIFGQQISKEIVDEFLNNKMKIENRTRDASIMFLDIRNFSGYCEDKSPSQINEYQNKVLGFMIEIVNKYGGVVNQILGDGFMATFGAPIQHTNHSLSAINAAMEIRNTLNKKIESLEIPETKIGIGIHSGEVVTGNVGTEDRKQYSVIGNTVILAARLEQLTKELDSDIIISKDAAEKSQLDINQIQSISKISLKGFSEQIVVYKLT